jgi:hypothetical protein
MSIPYISLSSLNLDDDINKSLMVTQEKTKSRTQPKYKLTLKEKNKSGRNKNKKQVNEGPIIKRY